MRFISSLCWVKKGASSTPSKVSLGKDELNNLFQATPAVVEEEEEGSDVDGNEDDEEVNDQIDKKYRLDEYDDDADEIKLESVNSLACFPSNTQDDFLTIKDEGEDSDEEDFKIKKSDNLLLCGHFDEDICSLNVYVFNAKQDHFYIHHDIMLPSYPICLEWLDFDPADEKNGGNYVAVGSFNSWVEIWDLDVTESLEPDFILGSQKKKKKNKILKEKLEGHQDAVLALSWNSLNRTVLASGSADSTIVLWDLNRMMQATKIKNHAEKVQALKFHPIEAFSLLSGSADKTVALYDCRSPNTNKKIWQVDGEVEQVLWNTNEPNCFLCSDDKGFVSMFDIRSNEAISTLQAHESSVSSMAFSSQVPNLLVTTSDDELFKVWDVCNSTIEFVHQKKLKIGPLISTKANPELGFLFAFGGAKSNNPVLWDVQKSKEVRKKFYPRMNMEYVEDEEDKAAEEAAGVEEENEEDDEEKEATSDKKNRPKKKDRKLKKQTKKTLSKKKRSKMDEKGSKSKKLKKNS